MAKKIHILKDDFTIEYYALGISTGETILQLIMDLNTNFGFSIKLTEPLTATINKTDSSFPYAHFVNDDLLKVELIKQKSEGNILLKQYSAMDFFIVFSGENALQVYEKVLAKIKNLSNISLATPIDSKKFKSIAALLNSR